MLICTALLLSLCIGTCSPEKIHPRYFKDVNPKRLKY